MSAIIDTSFVRSRVKTFNTSASLGSPSLPEQKSSFLKPQSDFTCYGGAKKLWDLVLSGAPEVMIHGPAETGKTIAALHLLDYMCWRYEGLQASMVRKVGMDLWSTFIPDFEKKVLKMEGGKTANGVTKYGGEKPEFYTYPNGSKIWVGGLDHPGKTLSAQRDVIYTNQTEEFEENDWETLTRATTGRAGTLKPGRLIGDCNPGSSNHWILKRGDTGALVLIKSNHKDNPTLFNPETGEMTAQGKISMSRLRAMTGVRYQRLYLGNWVAAEGTVYEPFTVIDAPYSPIRRLVAGVDWGWTNPGGFQIWGLDGDGRMYRVMEQYRTKVAVVSQIPTDDTWVKRAIEADKWCREKYEVGVESWECDPSEPSFISAFQSAGLPAQGAFNSILPGIQQVEGRQKVQEGDGLARIFLLKGSKPEIDPILLEAHKPTCFEEEVQVYVYPKDSAGRANKKENPVDKDNHACDMCRYATAHVEGLGESQFMFGRDDD